MDYAKLARVTAKLELAWWKFATECDRKGEIKQTPAQRSRELQMWDRMRRCRVMAAVAAEKAGKFEDGSKLYKSELKRLGCYVV